MEHLNQSFLNGVNIPVSASIMSFPPQDLTSDSFITPEDEAIIPNTGMTSSFIPNNNLIEFYAYDTQKNIISSNYDFKEWGISGGSLEIPETTYTNNEGIEVLIPFTGSVPTNAVTLNPPRDLFNLGFDTGKVYALYNFINYELGSSIDNTYYISEISGDRTEVRLRSNTIPQATIRDTYQEFLPEFQSNEYFDEFYLGLFNNRYEICTNILLEEDDRGISILLKLYNELDPTVLTDSQVYVVTKVGETISYKVEFEDDLQSFIDNATYIKGPNINIPLQDLINNSTTLQTQETLLDSKSSGSTDNVLNILNQTGVTITPDYSYNTFSQFVNFSSVKERLNNFVEKVQSIQAYESDITTLETITGSNPTVTHISTSIATATSQITELVANFDGYENYLYYNSSSYSYPKIGSSYPYTLQPTTNVEVLTWIGSDVENSQYYGGYLLSASLYDQNNQNWLYYTIPTFITENSNNEEYVTFSNMVGQSFDEVWLYTKALSERYNTTNDPNKGLPLDLAADAIKGLGFETFGNNYDNQDNYIGLAGENDGTYVPPTGSELITKYIAVNNGEIINYWHDGYSWDDYVAQYVDAGFPYAIDKVSKEIYKRLYHNMAYLTKKKGSISGLRQLINIWGIPNTILRINEFGGKNRDNTDDYDLWQNRYSYTYTPVAANNYFASSSVKVPWMPLERNYIADTEWIVPDGVALRFKAPKGAPFSNYGGSFYSQSIAVKKSNGLKDNKMDWGISLYYEDQPSGSYSGSSNSDYYNYGKLKFYISASQADGGVQESSEISLPFFDGGWWSVLLKRDQHVAYTDNSQNTTYTLLAANKQVNGLDGNSLGWSGTTSITTTSNPSINEAWNRFGVTDEDGVYVGGYVSGSSIMTKESNEFGKIFSGSFQEFRYYSHDIPTTVFNDFVMNPESIEGNNITGSESSFDIVNFRAPLGNELEHIFSGSTTNFRNKISSSHPAITGSSPLIFTQSFIDPPTSGVTSSYDFIGYNNSKDKIYSKPNTEVYFLDQPSIGIRNRISNKIQVEDDSNYGDVLSKYRSIDQNYLISQSYTEDITSLEVGFSPQDEVNDDIIASLGYGAISPAIADPRFFYDSQEVYYPKLRQISENYFKKYTEGSVWDYLRLIKYFDNSLFKAIKSYVPARTSVTTGVIIKQNMLERNRIPPVRVNPNTIIAYTPETGSIEGGQSTQTGMNSAISYRDLEITGSIEIGTLNGGTGGVVEPLNTLITQTAKFAYYRNISTIYTTSPQNIFYSTNIATPGILDFEGNITESQGYDNVAGAEKRGVSLSQPLKTRFYFQSVGTIVYANPSDTLSLIISSSIRGGLGKEIVTKLKLDNNEKWVTNYYKFTPEEEITFSLKSTLGDITIPQFVFNLKTPEDFQISTPFSSSLHNQYTSQSYIVRNNTVSGSIYTLQDTQDEFYNGEYSGSTIVVTTQSLLDNPYVLPQTLNTSYIVSVTQSVGTSIPISFPSGSNSFPGKQIEGVNSYPSYSCDWKMYASSDPLVIKNDYVQFRANNLNVKELGALFFLADQNNPTHLRLAYSIIPGSMFAQNLNCTTTPASLFGWNANNLGIGFDLFNPLTYYSGLIEPRVDIPLPPTSTSGILKISSGDYTPNNIGPYFKLNISGSINGATYPSLDFDSESGMSSLPSNIILSNLMGSRNIIDKSISSTGDPQNGSNWFDPEYSLVRYVFNDPLNSGARPITFNASLWSGATFKNPFKSSSAVAGRFPINISPFDEMLSGSFSSMNNNNVPSLGSASLTVFGSTWTGSFGDSGHYAPQQMIFNNQNEDQFGNVINNLSTLINSPTFNFDITNYSGNPTSTDTYGLPGNYFSQKYNPLPQVQTYVNNSGVNASTGYVYNISTNRQLSGDPYDAVLTDWFRPATALFMASNANQYIPFNPQLPNLIQFINSPFNPLINNATASVKNTYLQVVEYDDGPIPSNFDLIVDRTALKAKVPDSFYTQKASILPRYVGSTLQSANYNTYTPSGSITYLNAFLSGSTVTGSSWPGDNSWGLTSVIDVNPIYMAHYKSSKENYELWGTYTFRIDSLIEIPLEDITGNNAPATPTVLMVNGGNQNLAEVRSTFEVDRSASVSYNSSKFRGVNYTSLKVGSGQIFQGAVEYQTKMTTQPNPTETILTASFNTASWLKAGFAQDVNTLTVEENSLPQLLGEGVIENFSSSGDWMSTGSNSLYFRGGFSNFSQSMLPNDIATTGSNVSFGGSFTIPLGTGVFYGSSLALLHNYNKYIQNEIPATGSIFSAFTSSAGVLSGKGFSLPGYPSASKFQLNNTQNYSYLEYSGSITNDPLTNLLPYENFDLPFLIDKGDEIRVTYDSNVTKGSPVWNTQTFTVTSAEGNTDYENGIYPWHVSSSIFTVMGVEQGSPPFQTFPVTESSRNYDKLMVYPDPSQLDPPITSGSFSNFTIRKRVNADDRVIIYQSPPSSSEGVETISGEGYLIPDDLTPQQKRNTLTLINQLNSLGAYNTTADPTNLQE